MTDQPNYQPYAPLGPAGQQQSAPPPHTADPRLDPETGRAWPTDRCMVTVGFYVLGRCGARAVTGCPRCGRGVCPQHVEQTPQGPLCLTCETELTNYQPRSDLDPNWAARYRRRYRTDASQRFRDDRLYWSFDRYDTYYTSPGMSSGTDDWNDFDADDVFDS